MQKQEPIRIKETSIFQRHAAKYLSDTERQALMYLLAAKPAMGNSRTGYPEELLFLGWGKNSIEIAYAVSDDLQEISLIAIFPKDESTEKAQRKDLKNHFDTLKKAGLGYAIREIIEQIKNHL